MLTGFRAGPDAGIGLLTDDFAGTRRAWQLEPGTALLGRVFPNGSLITTSHTPSQVVAKAEAKCRAVLDAGMWPYFSLKPDVLPCINGQLDAQAVALARYVAGLRVPFYFSIHHEPENDAMGAGSTPDHTNHLGRATNFARAHARWYQVMKEVAGDLFRMGPCHMVYQWRPGSATTSDGAVADAWRVPEQYADFYGADSYTSNWSWMSSGQTLQAKSDFQRWLAELNPTRSKVMLAERGVSRTYENSGDPVAAQAEILTADYRYLRSLGAHALMYWNSGGANDDSVYLLGAPGRAAFRQLAIDAATPEPAPEPEPDRYQEGYTVGFADGVAQGRTEGAASGRHAAFREVAAWATSQAGVVA